MSEPLWWMHCRVQVLRVYSWWYERKVKKVLACTDLRGYQMNVDQTSREQALREELNRLAHAFYKQTGEVPELVRALYDRAVERDQDLYHNV